MSEADRAYWDRQARRYDRSMFLLGGPLERMRELCIAAVGPTDRVLEVAAGTGLVTLALAQKAAEVVATDYAETMVELLGHRLRNSGLPNVTWQQADLTALPFPEGSFDVVVASNVLHLLPDIQVALTSLRRVLRPGGKLVIPTYCHDQTWLSRRLSRLLALTGFPGYRRLSLTSLCATLDTHGLQVTQAELINGPLPIGFVQGTF